MSSIDRPNLDDVARALATGANRRGILRTLGGGLLAGVATTLGVKFASAAPPDPNQPSLPQPEQQPVTLPGRSSCARNSCGVGYVCDRGQCLQIGGYCGRELCAAGATCASRKPAPGQTDPVGLLYCQCPGGQVAQDGVCVCPPGRGCSGVAAAGRLVGPDPHVDLEYTTAGICCERPFQAIACSNSGPGMSDGFAVCCLPGVDCPVIDQGGQRCATAGISPDCEPGSHGGSASIQTDY